jgi:hypothetical protein
VLILKQSKENLRGLLLSIQQAQKFADTAKHGKGTMGLFYGFKLHLLINHIGETISVSITPGNTNDRTPVPNLCKNLTGKLLQIKVKLVKLG